MTENSVLVTTHFSEVFEILQRQLPVSTSVKARSSSFNQAKEWSEELDRFNNRVTLVLDLVRDAEVADLHGKGSFPRRIFRCELLQLTPCCARDVHVA